MGYNAMYACPPHSILACARFYARESRGGVQEQVGRILAAWSGVEVEAGGQGGGGEVGSWGWAWLGLGGGKDCWAWGFFGRKGVCVDCGGGSEVLGMRNWGGWACLFPRSQLGRAHDNPMAMAL